MSATPGLTRAPGPGRRLFALPSTRLGWASLALVGGFFAFIGVQALLVASGQEGGDELWSNVPLLLTGLAFFASAIAAGVTGALAVVRGERSLLMAIPTLLGLFWLMFLLGEFLSPH